MSNEMNGRTGDPRTSEPSSNATPRGPAMGSDFQEQKVGDNGEFKEAQPGQSEPDGSPTIQSAHLEVILDVPVTVSLEIGRTRISIRELLQLNPGSVVKLDRMAGDPMDIMVNGCLIAKGEVVVVGEKFGIRITDVVSPEERIKTLQ